MSCSDTLFWYGFAAAVFVALRWDSLPSDINHFGTALRRAQPPINAFVKTVGNRGLNAVGLTHERLLQWGLVSAAPRPPPTPKILTRAKAAEAETPTETVSQSEDRLSKVD